MSLSITRRRTPSRPVSGVDGGAVVAMHGLCIGYDDRPVVRDVDFSLHAGEVVALLGANGSGKTTLIRGILGLSRIMGGSLELFGTPAGHFHDRHRIGYVPQRHTVGGGIPSTVTEVVSSGRLARKGVVARMGTADRAAVTAAIEFVGLEEKAGADVAQLSGGQQRRTLIARALAAEPDILVLDEPTAGVDAANQELLAVTLSRLVAQGTTLLLVTHELGPIAPLVSRVLVMRDGRVAHDGPPTTPAGAPEPAGDAHHHEHGAPAAGRPGFGVSAPLQGRV